MAIAESALLLHARRAYETGRVLLGLRHAAAVLPMAALSLAACGRPLATCLAAIPLAAMVAIFEWRGEGLGRASRVGLLSGLPPFLLPMMVGTAGHVCGPSFCASCSTVCFLSGVIGGALVGGWAARRGAGGVAAAASTAAVVGSMGCLVSGLGGVVGLVAGLALGVTPVVLLRRA